MANYSTNAQIVVSVNGRQADQMMQQLTQKADGLRKQIEAVEKAPVIDKNKLRQLQQELRSTEGLIDRLRNRGQATADVLRQLDKATPKELNKTLRQLKNELNGIERGSEAWDAQMEKIRAVKAELRALNEEMSGGDGFMDRLKGYWDEFKGSMLGMTMTVTGIAAAAKECVDAYAEMDQAMAGVRKTTGLSAEEVATLNEEFKKIDTRTGREQLNALAEEAGMLGKSSVEDVLGYVRAADKVNVALSELGEGATQTLSKLTGVFGDEARLGTEQALLSVGSVINELSASCAASAPYLTDFASRMGGVGSQAGMTVQQIMSFGAILDANGQNVERSSTALANLVTKLYQDPANYAKAAGMDVKRFSDLVKTDMNAALLEFLGTLKEAGGMDTLAPMFADMGEKGSGMVATLSSLAANIDDVRAKQEIANAAFEAGTSIGEESTVQNETAQAQLEKTTEGLHELAVTVGEQLMPLANAARNVTGAALGVLSTLIRFIGENKGAVLTLVAAYGAYSVAANAAAIKTAVFTAMQKAGTAIATAWKGVVLLTSAAFNSVTGNATRATAAMRVFNATCKANPLGLLVAAITAAVGALAIFISKSRDAKKATEEANKQWKEWSDSLVDLSKATAEAAAAEEVKLKSLYSTATDAAKSTDERRRAAERLQQLYPAYFGNLSTEQIMVGQAAKQYDTLRESILKTARARAAAAKIEENEKAILELEEQAEGLKSQADADRAKADELRQDYEDRKRDTSYRPASKGGMAGRTVVSAMAISDAQDKADASNKAYAENQRKQAALNAANAKLAQIAEDSSETPAAPGMPTVPSGGGGSGKDKGSGGGSGKAADKFAAEKEWREEQEARLRIDYATGVRDYIDYTEEMNQVAVDFYEKQLDHTDLSEAERLKITAQWREAQKKQDEFFATSSADIEEQRHNDRIAELKQFYLDGQISKATYDAKTEEAEIEHQRQLVKLSKAGTKERASAESKLQDMLIAQTEKRRAETEKKEQEIAKMRQKYFGDSLSVRQAQYETDLAMLTSIYEREIAATAENAEEKLRIEKAYEDAKADLRKGYNLDAETDTRNAAEKAVNASVEWLNSDGGRAVTGTISTLTSGMSAIFSQMSAGIQADLEMQTAAINKRYDTEIARAQGNSYQVRKLEKEKEREIAKLKADANRKMFAMQVIEAVAQTATSAINAYSSAAAVPVVGYVLAPIAAAMAVAAGMMQVANIKKQQQAAATQGYSEGGFTRPGRKDEPAGVVHAGEWVASQRLVNNPQTRPIIEALEYAQRTNRIGSITTADVARTITAPVKLAEQGVRIVAAPTATTSPMAARHSDNSQISDLLTQLNDRLAQPIVAYTTIAGPDGVNAKQEEYSRLMKNKSPKYKK